MRKVLKVAKWVVVVVGVLAAAAVAYFFAAFPKAQAAPDVTVSATPEALARGEYLFHHVLSCVDCHSAKDRTLVGAPAVPGALGRGGDPFPLGDAGTLHPPNLTPAALGNWTDGEIMRAVRDGVSRDGGALFPLMPYIAYRHLAEPDLHALVAYVRSLPPVENEVPDRELAFPLNVLVRTMPSPAGPVPAAAPDPAAGAAYGEYLVTVAACSECHTQNDRGTPLAGMYLAGGGEFPMGEGRMVRSANITPDVATGIGNWTKEMFVARFKDWSDDAAHPRPRQPGENASPMPWLYYSGMTESDLGAIYDYLRTVTPVRHAVVRFERTPVAE